MTAQIIYGTDFKARRERELESMAAEIMNVALGPFYASDYVDTATADLHGVPEAME